MIHYDDEVLFRYAEGTSPIAGEIASHVASCGECSAELGSHQEIVAALRTEEVWSSPAPAPRQFVVDVVSFSDRVKVEDGRAVTLCDEILTGPPAWWVQRLRRAEGVYTAGMVRELLGRMRQVIDRAPANALQITSLAIEVANALDVVTYPCDYVVKLRAQAYRDHAYVLSVMGRFPEAIDFTDRSKRLFDQVPLPEYDLARLALVRASILSRIDRANEAASLARQAAETFRRFGDHSRVITARIFEGVTLFEAGAYEQALEILKDLDGDPALDQAGALRNTQNIAACYSKMGQPERAIEYIERCLPELDLLGMDLPAARARWTLGQCLVSAGKASEAIPVLRKTWRRFEELEADTDSGLVALDLATALLIAGRAGEVPAICRDVITRFTRAGMASRAITALSFLREAVAIGQGTPSLVQHVYAFLRELPAEQPRLFAPPPGGLED
jgi:tetratricopeptide (TPR) repeat protein